MPWPVIVKHSVVFLTDSTDGLMMRRDVLKFMFFSLDFHSLQKNTLAHTFTPLNDYKHSYDGQAEMLSSRFLIMKRLIDFFSFSFTFFLFYMFFFSADKRKTNITV
jgi:hypothetical protein